MGRELIKLASTGKTKAGNSTGYFVTTDKNKVNTPDKVEMKKFDPRAFNEKTGKVGMHVIFKEEKLK